MAVFDESKVINALHTDKAEIGKKYYMANGLKSLQDIVKENTKIYTLREIWKRSWDNVFQCETLDNFCFLYPYEEPEKKLDPFTWEDREQLRGKWVKEISGFTIECQITSFIKTLEDNELFVEVGNDVINADRLLNNYTFLDGSPCGKVVEE